MNKKKTFITTSGQVKEEKIEKAKLKYKKGGQVQGCGCPYGMEMGPNNLL
tara:strand:+ start:209 stop:358 length:150 start_codon:yes stop_codon:yes gene_type:complete